ncbi:hypothetical protein [Shewanella sp. Isolate8]|uniref:hypothetical protein n=1 Tax=Shewanella sp. Isolate8 TaxID=2908529 RepID=UPI001EFC6CCF|nr:hypothetical protein [Shewanella sp. Isolate8]MCG9748009.1 hypothetical protein [Shewanella sp. Isolate8]
MDNSLDMGMAFRFSREITHRFTHAIREKPSFVPLRWKSLLFLSPYSFEYDTEANTKEGVFLGKTSRLVAGFHTLAG